MKEKVKYKNDGEGIKEEGQGWTRVILNIIFSKEEK